MNFVFRNNSLALFAVLAAVLSMSLSSCGGKDAADKAGEDSLTVDSQEILAAALRGEADIPMATVEVVKDGGFRKVYNVADINDTAAEYKTAVDKGQCFFVVSKKEYRLYVYEACGVDTLLVAHYPVCYAKNAGDKKGDGDNSTPESKDGTPFTISQIVDASTWCHDFGWGNFPAYGHYFMRLLLTGSQVPENHSIGIHGSTNNVESVPGRDSEGCIRLRDADIIRLHDLYAQVGTKVYVKGLKKTKLPFEVKAAAALGEKYKAPTSGNPLAAKATPADADTPGADGNLGEPQGKIPQEATAGAEVSIDDF